MQNIIPLKPSLKPGVPAAHVSIRAVTQIYPPRAGHPSVHALGPIDLDLRQGEFLSVIGPSGCGKSTLLEVLAGLTSPSSGEVELAGRRIAGRVPEEVGVVFQEDASFPWLTVVGNVAFGLRRSGMEKAEIARRVDHAISFMGLSQFRTAYPAQLSGGMRQRVCIARTLVMRPKLILLDEPFGALDQQTRLLMGEELLRLWRETGATVMLITHSLDEAALLADRVAVMSARPGKFIEVIETGWPGGRDSSLVSMPEFGVLTGRLWALLQSESRKAMGLS